jgi:hypothetical protein
MAVQYPALGFLYVEGPNNIRWSTVSSTATFKAGNPVTLSDVGRALIEVDSGSTTIYGIALANAADSLGGALDGKIPVLVPTEQTVFAARVQTGVAASVLETGEAFDIEKSGDYFRVDTDSKSSARVHLVERGTSGLPYDSTDSSVHCQFFKDVIYPFGSNASLKVGL